MERFVKVKHNLRSEKRKSQRALWILREIDRCVLRPIEMTQYLAQPIPNPRQVQSAYIFLSPRENVIVVTNSIMSGQTSVTTDWTSIPCRHVMRDFLTISNYYKQVDVTEIMVETSLGVLSPTVYSLWEHLGDCKAIIFLWKKCQEF